MEQLLTQALTDAQQITADRRYLHAHAETGFDLHETYRYVWDMLTGMGLTPWACGRCGIVADVGAGERFVLLRADMDALPVREEADVPFACPDGRMHACGHDLHTAMLLGAARLLKSREAGLRRRIRLMFQPAEEILQGAADMLHSGLLEGGECIGAFMLHVLTNLDLPVGTAIVSAPGVSAPAAAFFRIGVQGKGCHGAMPHTGIDPISTAAHIVLSLQQVQTRELAMAENAVMTLGMLRAGESANVIPDTSEMAGTLRAFADDTVEKLLRRADEVSVQTARLFGATVEFAVTARTPTLCNDSRLSALALQTLQGLLGKEKAMLSSQLGGEGAKSTGSEDFACVSHAAPSVMIALAAGRPQDGCDKPAHHPQAVFDEAALPVGAAIYAALALAAME